VLILIKMKTAMPAGALAAPILATAFAPTPPHDQDGALRLASTSFSYRAAGDFSQADRSKDRCANSAFPPISSS
jgi:hypothetical protein